MSPLLQMVNIWKDERADLAVWESEWQTPEKSKPQLYTKKRSIIDLFRCIISTLV
jgi:hypothetical protein